MIFTHRLFNLYNVKKAKTLCMLAFAFWVLVIYFKALFKVKFLYQLLILIAVTIKNSIEKLKYKILKIVILIDAAT